MRKHFIFLSLATMIGLSGCGDAKDNETTSNAKSQQPVVAQKEMNSSDVKQLVSTYSTETNKDQSASITATQLIVTNSDDSEVTYDLPEDEFFVAIAPYVNETHPCATHSLTGCQGEMTNEEFNVSIEDTEGNAILNQTLQSNVRGFINLWLPKNKEYTVTITKDEKTTQSQLSTFEDDNTCITTMQLS